MNTLELTPTDSRKSFYGKAKIKTEGNISYLYSYDTCVAEYNNETREIKVYDFYSATTSRHQNAFLNHFGFKSRTKKELQNS